MPSIVAIDDDPSILSLIDSICSNLGCECRSAPSLEDGEALLAKGLPELLIVDGLLPDGTGIELLARVIRENDPGPKTLFLSAFFKGFRTFEELHRMGVDKVIHKPVTPESLTKEIADLLGVPVPGEEDTAPAPHPFHSELAGLQAKFIESLPEKADYLEQLCRSVDSEDIRALQVLVHRIAGTAGTYGLPGLSEAAHQIDRALLAGKPVSAVSDQISDLSSQLRAARPTDGVADEPKATHDLLKFRKVLFIHEESSSADLLRAELTNAGLFIERAEGPEDALARLPGVHPDIVIAECCEDVSDEEIAGLSRLRDALDSAAPILFLTRHEDLDRRVAASIAGSALFLTEPVSGTEVLKTIQKCLVGDEASAGSIIVVDDDPATVELTERVLSADGLRVRGATDPQAFWDELEREEPALIVLDVQLPVYSGYELCRVIKSDPRYRDIPVVMMTARNEVSDRIAAFQAGADDFVPKPIVPEEFVARVRARMRKAEEVASRGLKDRLTGLLTRAAMEEILDRALRQFRRSTLEPTGVRAGVMLIDVDDLTRINERRGPRLGDAALQLVADSFDQAVRPGDPACRWGGEEFVILLGDASEENCRATFERLQRFLAEHPIETGSGKPLEVCVSGGAARFEAGDTPLSLIRRADAALYWAKERGKNRLEFEAPAAAKSETAGGIAAGFHGMVGASLVMQEPFRRIRLAAQSDVTALLRGESGTGKELAARAIHDLSERHEKPFVAVNCSALPEGLLESELFGHVKGAFTGAHRDKVGVFESARGGTLFLDEIGDVSPLIQLKLLRVLQEREIRRVGGENNIPVDVRVVTATNKNLELLIERETFREDFYYRIRVFEINLPPLRERRDDVPLLIDSLVTEFSRSRGKPVRGLTTQAMERLKNYAWPGNVRELRNAIEHAFVTVSGERITIEDFPPELREASVEPGGQVTTRAGREPSEREQIVSALRHSGGNRTRAAEHLGISRVTLWKKIAKYEIDVEAIV